MHSLHLCYNSVLPTVFRSHARFVDRLPSSCADIKFHLFKSQQIYKTKSFIITFLCIYIYIYIRNVDINEIRSFVGKWIELEFIMLDETSNT